jgi:uncharacterized membrane protein
MADMRRFPFKFNAASIIILIIAIAGTLAWIILTPPGLWGKADAIGYAVCHRIAERSYDIGGRELPLCARCTGMYLGAFAGLIYLGRKGRRGKFPPGRIWVVLGVFALVFALDSLNSFAMLLPGSPSVYLTTNLIRLFAGTGMGIIIPVVLWPVFNQTVWLDFEDRPILESWKELGLIMLFALILDLSILSGVPFLVLPAALISAGTVLVILTLVYTVVWTMVQRKENQYRIWSEIWVLLLLGFITALGQIALMDILRYNMTGTWSGFIPQ